jgi:hypothetical protein
MGAIPHLRPAAPPTLKTRPAVQNCADGGVRIEGSVKRADALAPLSRDHLTALLAAKRVVEAGDVAAAAGAFSAFWDVERHHFRLEEEILLPHWAAHAEVDAAAVERMLADHLAIRADAVRLEHGGLSLDELHALGTRLHDHVRFEERVMFPAIEEALAAEAMDRLGAALAAAHPRGEK